MISQMNLQAMDPFCTRLTNTITLIPEKDHSLYFQKPLSYSMAIIIKHYFYF